MVGRCFGHTLVIANPAARSGRGAQEIAFIERALTKYRSATTRFRLCMTTKPGDAIRMARSASAYDTVLVFGGDGVIHDVVNGLMHIGLAQCPCLGIIPYGSGNDYARTLGMALNMPDRSLGQLFQGVARRVDLGLVNGTYFDETLSFGLDAQIALATTTHRTHHGIHGALMFASDGLKAICQRRKFWPYHACVDGKDVTGASLLYAVQVGPTYGGGFRICPQADFTDGLFDVCYTEGHPSTPTALSVFVRARFAAHTTSPYLRFMRAHKLTLDFEGEPPCQVDGEPLSGSHFEITCAHRALEVVVPTWSS